MCNLEGTVYADGKGEHEIDCLQILSFYVVVVASIISTKSFFPSTHSSPFFYNIVV